MLWRCYEDVDVDVDVEDFCGVKPPKVMPEGRSPQGKEKGQNKNETKRQTDKPMKRQKYKKMKWWKYKKTKRQHED